MIVEDVRAALLHGRNPVVITERKEHLFWLENAFADVKPLFVMRGGMRRKELTSILQAFSAVPEGTPRLLLATGKFLGEGFDDPRLDTLFLTMPISWKGTLAQYAGRLHRLYDRKTEVIIYDYADLKITMTMRMEYCWLFRFSACDSTTKSAGFWASDSEYEQGPAGEQKNIRIHFINQGCS